MIGLSGLVEPSNKSSASCCSPKIDSGVSVGGSGIWKTGNDAGSVALGISTGGTVLTDGAGFMVSATAGFVAGGLHDLLAVRAADVPAQ